MASVKIALLTKALALLEAPAGFVSAATESPGETRSWPALIDRIIETLANKLGVDESRLREVVKETMTELRPEFEDTRRQPRQPLSIIRTFISEASGYIGLDAKAFVERLRNGESAAAIAESEGKHREGLVDALVDKADENFDRLVAAGILTQERAESEVARLEQLINRWADYKVTGPKARRPVSRQANGHFDLSSYRGAILQ